MALDPSAIVVRLTASALSSLPGQPLARYAYVLDLGRVFRWSPGSVLVADTRTVLAASGGTAGAWLLVRHDDAGAALTDAAETLTVGGGAWRTLPAATLTAARAKTLPPAPSSARWASTYWHQWRG